MNGYNNKPKEQYICRRGDMSPTEHIKMYWQEDGDVCLMVVNERGESADMEFCVPGTGGGKSPRTHEALLNLMAAIEKDNEDSPEFSL